MELTTDTLAGCMQRARHVSGMSRSELARLVETSRGALDQIEKGERIPRVPTFLRVINACGGEVIVNLDVEVPANDVTLGVDTLALFASGLDAEDDAWMWRSLISGYVANVFVPASRTMRSKLLTEPPKATGSYNWDRFLLALGEYLAVHAQIPVPSWARNCDLTVAPLWWPVHGALASMRSAASAFSPPSFERRGILIDGRELPLVRP